MAPPLAQSAPPEFEEQGRRESPREGKAEDLSGGALSGSREGCQRAELERADPEPGVLAAGPEHRSCHGVILLNSIHGTISAITQCYNTRKLHPKVHKNLKHSIDVFT